MEAKIIDDVTELVTLCVRVGRARRAVRRAERKLQTTNSYDAERAYETALFDYANARKARREMVRSLKAPCK